MAQTAKSVIDQALELNSSERAEVAEKLLSSLDTPDPRIDAIWIKETEARYQAFERDEIESIFAEKVFEKYNTRES